MLHLISELLFPPKCVICKTLLTPGQVDMCPSCRKTVEDFTKAKNKFSFIAGWTCVWYYSHEPVRQSILRFKFNNHRNYAQSYGRMLAIKLQKEGMDQFDLLTWVPISALRKFKRAYDQVELLTNAVGQELNVQPVRTLKKIRHTPPQSTIRDHSHRRANVLGVYKVRNPALVKGKRILLLDDIITSGSTASECAKMLLTAGAKEVRFAAIASAVQPKA